MKKLILGIVIIAVWLGVGASASLVYGDENSKNNVINVADFGAIPNDNQNDAAALRKAVQACRDGRADTLLIPAGRYLLADEKAMKLQNDALHGRLGNNPQPHIFNKDFDYVVGLDFTGIRDLNIQAKDVELLCDGWMEPISLVETENITINGLTIDYKRPPNSAGEIIRVDGDTIDVKFFDWCPVFDEINFCRYMIYDNKKQRLSGGTIDLGEKELIAPQVIRFKAKHPSLKKGRVLMCWHGFHFRPAILLYKAKDTVLNDVTIHAQPGMGIVGHLSENITANRLKIVPRSGRYFSSNTDATHFASCYGFIHFDGCEFGGQGDDSINVHNYYQQILDKPIGNTCRLGIRNHHDLHSCKIDYPRVGDRLAVVRSNTLEEVGYVTVKSVKINQEDYTSIVEFDGTLPESYKDYYLANLTALPQLVFKNCYVRSHRARSVLCKTRGVLIENNIFDGCTGTAVHIGAEGSWMEGATSEDVVIRNNKFLHCGYGDGTIANAAAVAIHVNAADARVPGLHKRILIESNEIVGGDDAISVANADDVTIRNNRFKAIKREDVTAKASTNVKILDNQYQ